MNLIQQPVLIASSATDNAVGMGIVLVMFALIITAAALRSLSKRARGEWMTFSLRNNPAYKARNPVTPCTGCPTD